MFERIIRFAIEQRWLVLVAAAAMASALSNKRRDTAGDAASRSMI